MVMPADTMSVPQEQQMAEFMGELAGMVACLTRRKAKTFEAVIQGTHDWLPKEFLSKGGRTAAGWRQAWLDLLRRLVVELEGKS
jgi:hypothetical protein